MRIIICPNCGKPLLVSDNPSYGSRKIRCPREGCGYTDYESAFSAPGLQQGISARPLFEAASKIASNPLLIREEDVDRIAKNTSCAHSSVVALINSLLDTRVFLPDSAMRRLRFTPFEQGAVSLDDLMHKLEELQRTLQSPETENEILLEQKGPDYRTLYLDLLKAFDRLEAEKNTLRDRAKALATENVRFKEMLGL